jgi:hypothetical protein
MTQGRVAGIDLSMALSVLVLISIMFSGALSGWKAPIGAFENDIVEDTLTGFFFYMVGYRSKFIIRTLLSGPRRSGRYFLIRSGAFLILGGIGYFAFDNAILLSLGLALLLGPFLSQLHSNFLYFAIFGSALASLIFPLNYVESQGKPNIFFEWWEHLLFLRYDSFLSWLMFFCYGMITGRMNFSDRKWRRNLRNGSLALVGFAIVIHFLSFSFFKAGYLAVDPRESRLLPWPLLSYRPAFLIGALPLCNLILLWVSSVGHLLMNSPKWQFLGRIGIFHLSVLTASSILAILLRLVGPSPEWLAGLIGLLAAGSIVLLFYLFQGKLRNGPVEWLIQRLY